MKYLNERFVKNSIIKWLSRKGYNLRLQAKETKEHGIDIKVRHNKYGRYFIVEVKGDPNPDSYKWVRSGRETAFNYVLGQIITRMKHKAKYWYAIGLPYTYRDKILRRLPREVCKKLRLKVLLVDKQGKVEEINWKNLK